MNSYQLENRRFFRRVMIEGAIVAVCLFITLLVVG